VGLEECAQRIARHVIRTRECVAQPFLAVHVRKGNISGVVLEPGVAEWRR
jgi:hypothetical protein